MSQAGGNHPHRARQSALTNNENNNEFAVVERVTFFEMFLKVWWKKLLSRKNN